MSTKKTVAPRARILAAALAVLRQGGPQALTQPRVARQAGVAQGHLTYYFPTRADLWGAVAEAISATLVAEYDAVAALAKSAPARAKTLRRLGKAVASSQRTRMLLGFALAADEQPVIRDLFRRLTRSIRESLAAGFAGAGLAADPDAAAMIHALCVGLAVLDLARGGAAPGENGRVLDRAFTTLEKPGATPARPRRKGSR